MEKVRLTLNNGQDVIIEHDTTDRTFDDVMQFSDSTYVVKANNGVRVPLRSIVTYQIMEEASNG